MKNYNLVHVLSYQEYRTPLVRVQLFEQAAIQQSIKGEDSPRVVEVWIVVPFRVYWDSYFNSYLKDLRITFPSLPIRILGGADRLANFPQTQLMFYFRKSLGQSPVIFHFRGDDLISQFLKIKSNYPQDRFVADIRGLWPAEFLLNKNKVVFNEKELLTDPSAALLVSQMNQNLNYADGLSTVSAELGRVIKKLSGFEKNSWTVPCAIPENSISTNTSKNSSDQLLIGYLGGTAPYQHLPDLVLPFMDCLIRLNSQVKLRFITHQPDELRKIISRFAWEEEKFEIFSVDQKLVQNYLKDVDLGLLIRKRNLVNQVAQPVKVGEYLAAGVPVLAQTDLSGLSISDHPGILEKEFEGNPMEKIAEEILSWLSTTSRNQRSLLAVESAKKLTWEQMISRHRYHYHQILNQN
ncbi:hypothetical protein [Algoriphagus sp.]|uniref:hypothetical protein n=1 Tax=Algoriphagus sp. TaxID=1872435 RepID=UPI00261802FF|nr:hypothetical protein [Algoriphagus sp.]